MLSQTSVGKKPENICLTDGEKERENIFAQRVVESESLVEILGKNSFWLFLQVQLDELYLLI